MQLSFSFQSQNDYSQENFLLTDEIKNAYDAVSSFFLQKDYNSSSLPSLIISGQECCGKTHLVSLFKNRNDTGFFSGKEINSDNFNQILIKKFCVIDDIDKIQQDEVLFNIINATKENKIFLLLTAQNLQNFKLRDLQSRLKNIIQIKIDSPSLQTIRVLFANFLARKQIKISNKKFENLVINLDRNYKSLVDLVKSL